MILEQASYNYDLSDNELLEATAELLQLGLTQSIQENGYPDFRNLKTELYGLEKFREGIFLINERIIYPDDTTYETRIFLSCKNDMWKVVTIEE